MTSNTSVTVFDIHKLQLFDEAEIEKGETPHHIIEKIQEWGLMPKQNTYKCPVCTAVLNLNRNESSLDFNTWRCTGTIKQKKQKAKRCDINVSIRTHTFFEKSHLPLWKILAFTNLWCHNTTLSIITTQLQISPSTANHWSSFCREVVFDYIYTKKVKIGGPNVCIQIDESQFGQRKHWRGHPVNGQWVFGGIEEGGEKVFLVPVPNRTEETLLNVLKEWVNPGTQENPCIIISDCWKSYHNIKNMPGFQHFQVNYSITFKDPVTSGANTIESTWRHEKAHMPRQKNDFFAGYLAKYLFFKCTKLNNTDPFLKFCTAAGDLYNPLNPPLLVPSE